MSSRITLIVPIKAKAGKEGIVRERIIALAESTRQESGNINYIPHELTEEPGSFVIYENWRDQAALDNHMNQEYLKKFLDDAPDLLKEEIQGTFCRVLSE